MQAELILDCKNQHGEGVFWNPIDGLLWWTDIEGKAIWSLDPVSSKKLKWEFQESYLQALIGCMAISVLLTKP